MTLVLSPQSQRIKHDPENGQWGDCFRTAVAVCLGRDAEQVPHVMHDPTKHSDSAVDRLRDWLRPQGLGFSQTIYHADTDIAEILKATAHLSPGIPFVLSGLSPRGPYGHCVVICDGEVCCDPATGAPVTDPKEALAGALDDWWWLECVVKLPDQIGN